LVRAFSVLWRTVIKLHDKGFRITTILALFIVFFILNGWAELPFPDGLPWHMLVSLATLAGVCEANRWLVIQSHRWFTRKYRLLKRLLVIVPSAMVLTAVLLLLNQAFHHYISVGDWRQGTVFDSQLYINGRRVNAGAFGSAALNGFLIFWLFFIIYETRYHFARLRFMEIEKDRLEKEKLKAELHHLKEMVNPHFLFNTLNSLSALISENPRQAEIFLDELTRVYRYLLRNNEIDLTTLTSELQFMKSYFHLLKTRYGDGIHFITDIKLRGDDYLLPPLTLQLLVENAVKHNRLMKDQPLTIHIFTTQNQKLVVSNNIQKKDTVVDSTRVGLQNINARYRLMQKPGITIDSSGNTFSVTVPLIESEV
jgi:two-component system LytT family sensor kinase